MNELPNILHITCHDLGRHLHCYGLDAVFSPNFDRLAAGGTQFNRLFCAAPQCSPSRASLYTGRWPHSNGVMGLTHADFGWELSPGETHLVQVLNEAGYHTAGGGVIHETASIDRIGFDAVLPLAATDAASLTVATIGHLQNVKEGDRPFYIQLGYEEPHRQEFGFGAAPYARNGIYVPPYLVDEFSAREDLAHFQGAIRDVDAAFGTLLDYLDRENLIANTLIIFTADHGIPFPRAKCSLYDPGLEITCLLAGPGIPAGHTIDALASNVDIMPTLLDFLGLPVPGAVQGISLLPLMRGEAGRVHEAIFGEMTYHDYPDPRRCVRTESLKLIVNFTNAPFFMDPSQMWRPRTITRNPSRPARAFHPLVEVYDLVADPLEEVNQADNPDFAAHKQALLRKLYTWMAETNDPILTGLPIAPLHRRALQLFKDVHNA